MERSARFYAYYQLLAYLRRMSQGDGGRALQHLEQALAASAEAGAFRQTIFLEAAFANAVVLGDSEKARIWMQRVKSLREPFPTTLVEAKLAAREGNNHRALYLYESARQYLIHERLDTGVARFQLERITKGENECRRQLARR